MFSPANPPLLVQPISTHHHSLFPPQEGYTVHQLNGSQALVSYKRGWTFMKTLQLQELASEDPLLLVRNKGGITSSSSTTEKGYAHQFCGENGCPAEPHSSIALFPEKPSEEWMLIRSCATLIWLQYGMKTQYIGSPGDNVLHLNNVKLLIKDLVIRQDFQPRLDRASDITDAGEKQYRVEGRKAFEDSWALEDGDVAEYLEKTLSDNNLDRYWTAVETALKRAMHKTK